MQGRYTFDYVVLFQLEVAPHQFPGQREFFGSQVFEKRKIQLTVGQRARITKPVPQELGKRSRVWTPCHLFRNVVAIFQHQPLALQLPCASQQYNSAQDESARDQSRLQPQDRLGQSWKAEVVYFWLALKHYVAVVVKKGDIHGSVSKHGSASEVLFQMEQSLNEPYTDIYDLKEIRFDECWAV